MIISICYLILINKIYRKSKEVPPPTHDFLGELWKGNSSRSFGISVRLHLGSRVPEELDLQRLSYHSLAFWRLHTARIIRSPLITDGGLLKWTAWGHLAFPELTSDETVPVKHNLSWSWNNRIETGRQMIQYNYPQICDIHSKIMTVCGLK